MNGPRRLPVIKFQDIKPELRQFQRRALLRNALSLGGLALLTGCDLSTNSGVDAALRSILRFDDKVQAALFSGRRLAQTYPVSAVTKPFRFNAYYPEWQVRGVPDGWRLEVAGSVSEKAPWTIEALRKLPQVEQITRHICIEGWSQIGHWSGVPLRSVPTTHRSRPSRALCEFQVFRWLLDQHRHAQRAAPTDDSGARLPWPAPRSRVGCTGTAAHPHESILQSAKNLQAIEVNAPLPGGFWQNQGYDWFSGA